MKASKFVSDLFAMLMLFFITFGIIVTELGIWSSPLLIKTPPDATERVAKLLDAVSRNDYAGVSECLAGNPDLGMNREPANSVGSLMWHAFTDSFHYSISGGFYTTDTGLAQDVTVEYLDIAGAMTGLNARAKELLEQRVKEAEHVSDVYDEDMELREDVVMEALYVAVSEALEHNPAKVTTQLTMNLVQQDGQWWVLADNALLSVISGGTL